MDQKTFTIIIALTVECGGLLVVVAPFLFLLGPAWRERRQGLLDRFGNDAIEAYFHQFRRSLTGKTDGERKKQFEEFIDGCYGRGRYVLPVMLLVAVTAAGAVAVARTIMRWENLTDDTFVLSGVTCASVLGAFVWVAMDHLERVHRRDLSRYDVFNGALRILLSVPFGISLTEILRADAAVPVAFLLGLFPTTTLIRVGRRLAAQRLGVGDDNDVANEIERLQGIGKSDAERFADEGINSIQQLAWSDPVDVAARTNRRFNDVVDWVSQALLWVYFDKKTPDLYRLSLRGAQEVASLLEDQDNAAKVLHSDASSRSEKVDAQATLDQVAATLADGAKIVGISEASLRSTLLQVAQDPYTTLLRELWE